MIKILVDSGCDLPEEIFEKYDIGYVPLHVIIDEVDHLDDGSIDVIEMYDKMDNTSIVSTSQVNHSDFFEYFEKCSDEHEYIYIALSSLLSSTYQSAVFVQNELKESRPNFNLHIVDTKSATMANGLMCIKAIEMVEEGRSVKEIVDKLEELVGRMDVVGAVDTLKHLQRGGRVGKAAAFIGNILNVKPIINIRASMIENIDKARGNKKKLQKLIDYVKSNLDEDTIKNTDFGVSHADNELEADDLIKRLKELGANKVYKAQLTAVLGAHTGRGMVAISYILPK